MIHIAASVAVTIVVTAIFSFIFGYPGFKVGFGIIPGVIAGVAFFFWRTRVVMNEVQNIMKDVEKLLQPPQTNPMRPPKPKIDEAIKELGRADKWRRYHPGLGGQLDGQIGIMLFVDGRSHAAEPYLEKSTPRNGTARAMYGVIQYRKKDKEGLKQTFDNLLRFSKKDALLWNTYAWCLDNLGDRDEAIAVLNRARKHVESDEKTAKNLDLLQNNKSMKMQGWGPMWYQFHLEKVPQQVAGVGGKQRFDRRSVYRGR